MFAALPPIPDSNCINDVAIDIADVMLSTAVELAPRSKRPRGTQGWCAGFSVEAEMNAAWQQREETRRRLLIPPCGGDCSKSSFVFGWGGGAAAVEICHHHDTR